MNLPSTTRALLPAGLDPGAICTCLGLISDTHILLWHSHYSDYDVEMASRRKNIVRPTRTVDRARGAGAQVAVFGHRHIPLVYRDPSVLVVNLGALASGNAFTRQTRQTVAILCLDHAGHATVVHVDLAHPDRALHPVIDWDAGFDVAAEECSAAIVTAEVADFVSFLRPHLTLEEVRALSPLVEELAHPIWAGADAVLTFAQIRAALQSSELPVALRRRLDHLLVDWRARTETRYNSL